MNHHKPLKTIRNPYQSHPLMSPPVTTPRQVRSLNGCRVADHILALVPDAQRWTVVSVSPGGVAMADHGCGAGATSG